MASDYDLVFQCLGQTYQTDFMNKNFQHCLSDKGQIKVNDFMQVEGNIYALGDVCLTPLNEDKSVASLKLLSHYLYKNILA